MTSNRRFNEIALLYNRILLPAFLLFSLLFSEHVFSHGGRLDASGCHNNRKTGGYHCHRGSSSATNLNTSKPITKTKTNSGRIPPRIRESSALTNELADWVAKSCPATLGVSLSKDCIARETSAAKAGQPDIESLTAQDKEWVNQSCPKSLGPRLTYSCMQREINALDKKVEISVLSMEEQKRVLGICHRMLGPSLFYSCVTREVKNLKGIR